MEQGQVLHVRRRAGWLAALLRPRDPGVLVAVLDQHGVTLVGRVPVAWDALREVQCINMRPSRGHEYLDAFRVLAFVPQDRQVLAPRGLFERLAVWRHGTPLVLFEPQLVTPLDRILDAVESLSDVPLVRIDDP